MAGGYTLDLYCDIEYAHLIGRTVNYQLAGGHAQFVGERGPEVRKAAREAGWKLGRGYVVCPSCVKHTNEQRRDLLHRAVAAGWKP